MKALLVNLNKHGRFAVGSAHYQSLLDIVTSVKGWEGGHHRLHTLAGLLLVGSQSRARTRILARKL